MGTLNLDSVFVSGAGIEDKAPSEYPKSSRQHFVKLEDSNGQTAEVKLSGSQGRYNPSIEGRDVAASREEICVALAASQKLLLQQSKVSGDVQIKEGKHTKGEPKLPESLNLSHKLETVAREAMLNYLQEKVTEYAESLDDEELAEKYKSKAAKLRILESDNSEENKGDLLNIA